MGRQFGENVAKRGIRDRVNDGGDFFLFYKFFKNSKIKIFFFPISMTF